MKASSLIPLFVFFLLGAGLAFTTNLAGNVNFTPSMVGKKIDNFNVDTLAPAGKFSSDIFAKNQFTILNLFASWCSSCLKEHELLKDLQAQGYQIYGLDVADKKAEANAYLKEHGNPYADIGYDPQRKLAIALGVTGVPETFVVDRNGIIYFHQRGSLTKDIIDRQMIPIIDGIKKKQ